MLGLGVVAGGRRLALNETRATRDCGNNVLQMPAREGVVGGLLYF